MQTTLSREKVVVVSNFVGALDTVQALCVTCGWGEGDVLRLDGAVSADQRSGIVAALNNPADRHWVLLLSSKAGGVGLNL